MPAIQWDDKQACQAKIVLCFECRVCGGGTDSTCFRNVKDGRLVKTSTWVMQGRPDWVECDPADRDKGFLGKFCS